MLYKFLVILSSLTMSLSIIAKDEMRLNFQSEEGFVSYIHQNFGEEFEEIVKGAKAIRPSIGQYNRYEYDWEIFLDMNCEPISKSFSAILTKKGINSKVTYLGRDHLGKPTHAIILADVVINGEVKKFVIDPTYRQFDNSLFSIIIKNLFRNNASSKISQIEIEDIYFSIPLIFVSELSSTRKNQLKLRNDLYNEFGDLVLDSSMAWMYKNSITQQRKVFMAKLFYSYEDKLAL